MSSISFLKNRQIGGTYKYEFRNRSSSLNLDHVFSRLVCHKKDIFSIRGDETDVPPFACKFRRDVQSDLLAVANEDGYITLYDTTKQHPNCILQTFLAHHNAVFDVCWLPDKCQLISGSGDHNAALWDMTSCTQVSIFKKHTASVKSIDICQEQSAIFATGSRDGSITVWDSREKNISSVYSKPAIVINQAHCRKNTVSAGKRSSPKDPISSVAAVAFQNSNTLASAGVADGVVKIWDLRRTYLQNSKYLPSPKYQMHYSAVGGIGHGCTGLVFDSQYKTLYGCSTNHKILKFNCHTYAKEADVYDGFRCTTYFVKLALSSDDKYLLCGSSDEKAYIWKTSRPGLPIMKLGVHSAEVTSVCWSQYDITKLVTCGDDNKVAIWKIAEAETPSVKDENILAVAETYSEDPKNENIPVQVTVQSSTIVSNITTRRSPIVLNQTPNRPVVRAITNFFSPVIPKSTSTPIKDLQSASVNSNNSPSPSNKLLNKSPSDSSSQVLTPCNHFHNNSSNRSLTCSDDSIETLSSPDLKNSSLENKNCSTFPSTSYSSVQDKENSSKHISPEVDYKRNNIGQTKRKMTAKHSTPNVKRKQTESSKKTKSNVKQEKKKPEKTIMNYFSIVLSPDN